MIVQCNIGGHYVPAWTGAIMDFNDAQVGMVSDLVELHA